MAVDGDRSFSWPASMRSSRDTDPGGKMTRRACRSPRTDQAPSSRGRRTSPRGIPVRAARGRARYRRRARQIVPNPLRRPGTRNALAVKFELFIIDIRGLFGEGLSGTVLAPKSCHSAPTAPRIQQET